MTNETSGDNNSVPLAEAEQALNQVDDDNPLKSVVEDLLDRVERVELSRDAAHKRIDELEGQIEEDNPKSSTGENRDADDDTTTLERIADDDQDDPAGIQIGPSIDRAAEIMSNWDAWSDKSPKGRNIKDGLLKLLETATGESLAWKQVYRAGKKVEQLTKGKIVFTKTNRHGWMLLQPSSVGNG